MAKSKSALRDILTALVDHWGGDNIRRELERLADRREEGGAETPARRKEATATQRRRRPTPSEVLRRYQLPDRIREDAAELTAMYEAKTFLPTIADVKHFLEARGRSISGVKNRDQAFVRIVDVVLSLPPDAIRQLRNSASHGVPARLGPISDAMSSAGDRLRAKG